MDRSKKILLAGYLALGFLVLRQIYALVFSGLKGETLLISLPEIRLPRPFSHITLLGDVSQEGVIRNLELGLPFTLSILFFGVLAAFISQSLLLKLAARFGPLRNFITSLALGLAVIPALFDAGRKVLFAISLRKEKRARILVPILERSIEIANALALRLTLESRPVMGKSGIKVTGLQNGSALIDLEVLPGETVVINGATGSGKTTILEAIVGISAEYRGRKVKGQVELGGLPQTVGLNRIASYVGFIPQNPRELTVGLAAKDLLAGSNRELVNRLGLELAKEQSTDSLSEGEIFKLVLAWVLSRQPSILILDEPFGALDAQSRMVVQELLSEYAALGNSVLISEHEPQSLTLVAKRMVLTPAGLIEGSYQASIQSPIRQIPVVGSVQVLNASLPELCRGRLLLQPCEIELNQAECVWLSGPNGSGKSTLLAELATSSDVKVFGESQKNRLVLVPEHFDDFFLCGTLAQELQRSDRIAKVRSGFTLENLKSILPASQIESLMATHPRDLSRGTRLALAIAMQLSHKPSVLLIDEPFRGLDPVAKSQVSETLRCVQETGCAVLFASHETTWANALATRRLAIENLQLREIARVSA